MNEFLRKNIQVPIFLCVILISGCATYKQAKTLDVNASKQFDGATAASLSQCTAELLREDLGNMIYHRNFDAIRHKWFIGAEFKTLFGSGNGGYSYSLSFRDTPEKTTIVEVHSQKTIWGSPQAPLKKIFTIIGRCNEALAQRS